MMDKIHVDTIQSSENLEWQYTIEEGINLD